MTAPSTALAEAVVRSRGGGSVLDWDADGAEPVKAYTAAPDCLLSAAVILEGLGFTVERLDPVSVTFRGPPGAFGTAFGVQLVYTPPAGAGPGSEAWRLAGGAGDTGFDVPARTRLGGVLRQVVLLPPPRSIKALSAFTDVRPGDLVIGDVGETLGTTTPARVAQGLAFPTGPAGALQATRAALARWADDPLRKQLHEHIDRTRGGRVTTIIAGESADPAVPAAFERLWPDPLLPAPEDARPPERRLAFKIVEADRDVFKDGSWPQGLPQAALAEGMLRTLYPAWTRTERALDDVRLAASQRKSLGVAASRIMLRNSWKVAQPNLLALEPLVRTLLGAAHAGDPFDLVRADQMAEVVGRLDTALESPAATNAWTLWNTLDAMSRELKGWVAVQYRYFQKLFEKAGAPIYRHGNMVSYAFLAVSLGAVPVRVHPDKGLIWSAVKRSDRWVFSYSAGADADHGIVAADVRNHRTVRKARLTGNQSRHILHVLASGNNLAPDRDVPSQDAIFAADIDNVLVVGGCEPSGTRWLASDATHGYTVRFPAAGLFTRKLELSIPHICATTKGQRGGAVVFPDPPAERSSGRAPEWWTGGGTSVSTPIVAAVCALVWSAFPDLSPRKVKAAVLAGAATLDGGEFHIPQSQGGGIDPDSNKFENNTGAKRVVLRGALIEAARRSTTELSEPLSTLLAAAPTVVAAPLPAPPPRRST